MAFSAVCLAFVYQLPVTSLLPIYRKLTTLSLGSTTDYMQTPILIKDRPYGCDDRGTLTCFDAKSGEIIFSERLPGNGFTASPVSDGQLLYITREFGKIWLVEAGREYSDVGINELGDNCLATPAISNGTLYFRTQGSLLAIADRP